MDELAYAVPVGIRGKRKAEAHMSLKNFAETVRTWRRRRVCIRELAQLTDRELADLGLVRSEIAEVVRRTPGL